MNAVHSIGQILLRDLETLRRELQAYPNESDIWKVPAGITNSAGNLTLHLTGNISYCFGTVIAENGYVRDRDAEFAGKNVPLADILARIDFAKQSVEDAVNTINDMDLVKPYPIPLAGITLTIGQFLVHLVGHFNYHVGQIDYHRRMTTGADVTVGAQNITELKA